MSAENLTLFDEFELKGFWRLPRSSDQQSWGSVSFSRDSGITLELLGNIAGSQELSQLMALGDLSEPIIQGFTANGKNVTLQDCYVTSGQYHFPGIPIQKFAASCLFVGDIAFQSEQDIRFASLLVNLTCLEDWVSISPFNVDRACITPSGRGVSATYAPAPIITVSIPTLDSELQLVGQFEMRADRRRELRWFYSQYFRIIPSELQPWEWFLDVIVGLSDLLTVFMWQPIYARRVIGLGSEDQEMRRDGRTAPRRDSTEVFWNFLTPQTEPELSEGNILFRFGSIQEDIPSLLENWFSRRRDLEPVVDLFIGSLYAGKAHDAFQFLAMTRVLEGLHRATIGGQYHSDSDYDSYRAVLCEQVNLLAADNDWKQKFINGEIRWGNQYSQRRRYRDLLRTMDANLRSLLIQDVDGFVNRIVDTRNYLTHVDEGSRANALHGADLTLAFWKLQILAGVLLLREAGLSDDQIFRTLSNNSNIMLRLNQARHI